MADKENSPSRKRAKYMCKFSDKIAQEYPDITRSKLEPGAKQNFEYNRLKNIWFPV